MTAFRTIASLLVLVVAGLLSSCIDGREEYWLQSDGSGRAEITYHLPAGAAAAHGGESGLRTIIANFLQQIPKITDSHYDVATEESRVRVTLQASFKSASALQDLGSEDSLDSLPSAVAHLVGDVTADLHGRSLEFSRTIRAANALPGSVFLPASQFDGHRLCYIMHLPAAPSESNATRTEDAGRTLIWDVPLGRAVRGPLTTRFNMAIPVPWRLVTAVAVPVSLAAGGFFLRRRKARMAFPNGQDRNPVL